MTNSLSIITINYNNADGLLQTIESILNQTFKSFEYIVIDGGSTDHSVDVIDTYKAQITYWVSEPDKGVYHAMNKGLKAASCDFVLFMNSGDLLHNNSVLEHVIPTLKPTDDLVYGDVVLKNNILNSERIQVHPEQLPFSYFFKQTICQQACFIKRSLFDRVFYFNEAYKISSDWEFLIYAIYVEKVNFRKIDLLISIYDMTGISSTSAYRPIAKQEREKTIATYFPLFKEDYTILTSYSSQRFAQLKRIENSVFLRTIVSVFFKMLLLFMPQKKK